jgi:hypothetical protein
MIRLKCVKDAGQLRIRIITPGYYREANCQFPRDLRVEGRLYDVDVNAIKLITSRGKYFYSVRQKSAIKVLTPEQLQEETIANLANMSIYEDTTTNDCTICMEAPKAIIIIPCGHYYTCSECTSRLDKCPICRCEISQRINKSDMG